MMNPEQRPLTAVKPAYRTERIIASLVMAWVLMLTSYMIFQDKALSEASMYFLKILLSLSGAVMLATLPGFFDINYSVGGLSIRAAGGAAAFVFIYTQSPNLPVLKSTVDTHSPVQSGRPGPTSLLSAPNSDELPVMVALSFNPSSVVPTGQTVSSTWLSQTSVAPVVEMNQSYADTSGGDNAPTTVMVSVASHVVSAAYDVARQMLVGARRQVMAYVDRVAAMMRSAVAWLGTRASALIEHIWPGGMNAAEDMQAFVAEVGDSAAEIVNSAVQPAIAAVSNLTVALEQTPSLLSNVGGTVREAPQTLTGLVSSTVQGVPEILSGTVSTVTGTVGAVTHDVVSTTKTLLTTSTTVVQGVDAQLNSITRTLNEVSPAIVSRIAPDLDMQHAASDPLRGIGAQLRNANLDLPGKTGDAMTGLPSLSEIRTGGIDLPRSNATDRLSERFARSEEIRGGCQNCLLQPIETGALSHAGGLGAGLPGLGGNAGGGRLGGVAAVSTGSVVGGGAAVGGSLGGGPILGGTAAGGGDAPGGAGPVGGVVGSVRSDVTKVGGGLLGRH